MSNQKIEFVCRGLLFITVKVVVSFFSYCEVETIVGTYLRGDNFFQIEI